MPIYAYICQECSHHFESLVQGSTMPECPKCHAKNLDKQLTLFAVSGNGGIDSLEGGPGGCGTCGDPRGPGACSLN